MNIINVDTLKKTPLLPEEASRLEAAITICGIEGVNWIEDRDCDGDLCVDDALYWECREAAGIRTI